MKPTISSHERDSHRMLSPSERKVTITDTPVIGIDFSPVMVSISGQVKCINKKCDGEPVVELTSSKSDIGIRANVDGMFFVLMIIMGHGADSVGHVCVCRWQVCL